MKKFVKNAEKHLSPGIINNLNALEKRYYDMSNLRVVNMGLVNAGKSSLLNALIKDIKDETFAVGAARKTLTEQTVSLTDEITLVDTPGIDVEEMDDETALNSVIASDIMLMVHNIRLGELQEIECKWISNIAQRLGSNVSERLIVVLSWIDGRDSDEDYPVSVDKIKTMLHALTNADIKMVTVSAQRYLKGIKENKQTLISKSNIEELRSLIINTATNYRQKKKAVFVADLNAEVANAANALNAKKNEISSIIKNIETKINEKYNRYVRQYEDYYSTLKGKIDKYRRLVKEYAQL